ALALLPREQPECKESEQVLERSERMQGTRVEIADALGRRMRMGVAGKQPGRRKAACQAGGTHTGKLHDSAHEMAGKKIQPRRPDQGAACAQGFCAAAPAVGNADEDAQR